MTPHLPGVNSVSRTISILFLTLFMIACQNGSKIVESKSDVTLIRIDRQEIHPGQSDAEVLQEWTIVLQGNINEIDSVKMNYRSRSIIKEVRRLPEVQLSTDRPQNSFKMITRASDQWVESKKEEADHIVLYYSDAPLQLEFDELNELESIYYPSQGN